MISKQFEVKQKEEAKAMGIGSEWICHTKYVTYKTQQQVTVVNLFKGDTPYQGIAICSMKDQFSRRTGRVIARGRAMKKARNA